MIDDETKEPLHARMKAIMHEELNGDATVFVLLLPEDRVLVTNIGDPTVICYAMSNAVATILTSNVTQSYISDNDKEAMN